MATNELTVTTRNIGGRHLIAAAGEIDVYTSPRLREAISAAIDAGYVHLVFDLESVDFLDSTGLGVFVGALKRVRGLEGTERGSVHIVCSHDRLLNTFRLTGLDKVFRIVPSFDTIA